MATNYPGSLDSFPAPGANLSTNPHSTLHIDAQDAIEAIEGELGLEPSGTSLTVRARLDDYGTRLAKAEYGVMQAFNYDFLGILIGGASTWTDWFTIGNVTIPAGASEVIVDMNINNWTTTTPTNPLTFRARVAVGGYTVGDDSNTLYVHQQASTTWRYSQWSWSDGIVIDPVLESDTVAALKVQVQRAAGASGTVQGDTGTQVSGLIGFRF